MSYDVHLFPYQPGLSWAEAFEAADLAADDGWMEPGAWQRIAARAQRIDGAFVDQGGEIEHQVGIRLWCTAKSGEITVPYWHAGALGKQVIDWVFALAQAAEDETGLTAYDPQMDKAVAELAPAERAEAANLYVSTSTRLIAALRGEGN